MKRTENNFWPYQMKDLYRIWSHEELQMESEVRNTGNTYIAHSLTIRIAFWM